MTSQPQPKVTSNSLRMVLFAASQLALGCCSEPEGCPEAADEFQFRLESREERSDTSCGDLDLVPGDVVVLEYVDATTDFADRCGTECPLFRLQPKQGSVPAWTEIELTDTEPAASYFSEFDAVVDGCGAVVRVLAWPIRRAEQESGFVREIHWAPSCAKPDCEDTFVATRLEPE